MYYVEFYSDGTYSMPRKETWNSYFKYHYEAMLQNPNGYFHQIIAIGKIKVK